MMHRARKLRWKRRLHWESALDILRFGELRGDQERKRDTQHHNIRADIEHRIRDQVVYSSRALHYSDQHNPLRITSHPISNLQA